MTNTLIKLRTPFLKFYYFLNNGQHNNLSGLSDDQKNDFIKRAKKMRNELVDNADKLLKYSDKLDEEIMRFLNITGVNYSEFER